MKMPKTKKLDHKMVCKLKFNSSFPLVLSIKKVNQILIDGQVNLLLNRTGVR